MAAVGLRFRSMATMTSQRRRARQITTTLCFLLRSACVLEGLRIRGSAATRARGGRWRPGDGGLVGSGTRRGCWWRIGGSRGRGRRIWRAWGCQRCGCHHRSRRGSCPRARPDPWKGHADRASGCASSTSSISAASASRRAWSRSSPASSSPMTRPMTASADSDTVRVEGDHDGVGDLWRGARRPLLDGGDDSAPTGGAQHCGVGYLVTSSGRRCGDQLPDASLVHGRRRLGAGRRRRALQRRRHQPVSEPVRQPDQVGCEVDVEAVQHPLWARSS